MEHVFITQPKSFSYFFTAHDFYFIFHSLTHSLIRSLGCLNQHFQCSLSLIQFNYFDEMHAWKCNIRAFKIYNFGSLFSYLKSPFCPSINSPQDPRQYFQLVIVFVQRWFIVSLFPIFSLLNICVLWHNIKTPTPLFLWRWFEGRHY